MKTLREMVAAVGTRGEELFADSPRLIARMDQLGATTAEELRETHGVDLTDPETARVVIATAIYVLNEGRKRIGRPMPEGIVDESRMFVGMGLACSSIGHEVRELHRDVLDR